MVMPLALGVPDSVFFAFFSIMGSPALLAPLVAFIIQGFRKRRERFTERRWIFLAGYYAVVFIILGMGVSGSFSSATARVVMPIYMFWIMGGVVFAILIFALPLPKLTRPGLCSKCGYDLRAHLPGEKCPECGTLVP